MCVTGTAFERGGLLAWISAYSNSTLTLPRYHNAYIVYVQVACEKRRAVVLGLGLGLLCVGFSVMRCSYESLQDV